MPDVAKESRTEPATGRRRDEARQKGTVAKSEEVAKALLLLTTMLLLWATGPSIWRGLTGVLQETMGRAYRDDLDVVSAAKLLAHVLGMAIVPLLPVVLACMAVGILANVGQVGFLVTTKSMEINLGKFNPVSGMKKFLSLRSLFRLGTSLLKMSAVLLMGYLTMRKYFPQMMGLLHTTPAIMKDIVCLATFDLGVRVSLLLMVIAAIDYAFQKRQYEKDLRMTKEEVKEDKKMTEGNPETKARVRSIQRRMAQMRMLHDVKKADVVVRNPTHYAVALKYSPIKAAAPVVVAKGANYMAKRILAVARKHNVPTMRDAPLAQMLYQSVQVGRTIPPKLYQAVAKLLVHIFNARGKKLPEA